MICPVCEQVHLNEAPSFAGMLFCDYCDSVVQIFTVEGWEQYRDQQRYLAYKAQQYDRWYNDLEKC